MGILSLREAIRLRPLRSVLYTPGCNVDRVKKALTLPIDAGILDLEDAVSPNSKVKARNNVNEFLSDSRFTNNNKFIIVRINALNTKWGHEDLKVFAKNPSVDAILLPKTEEPETVKYIGNYLNSHDRTKNMQLWAMIETPRGVLDCDQIAKAHARLTTLVMGTSDLSKELGCHSYYNNRQAFLTSLQLVILAGKANGLALLDGVHLDLNDQKSFEESCWQGKYMGFDGKTLIHPKTIEMTNKIFGPSKEAVEEAKVIIKAHEEALEKGDGIVVVNGKLIENLHVAQAHALLEKYQAIQDLNNS